jgi:hypothetical protein
MRSFGLFPYFINLIKRDAESLYKPFPSRLTYTKVVLSYNAF